MNLLEIRVSANVPGGIYSDLEDSGIFSNAIYHEYNDMENRWVGRTSWTFERVFIGKDAYNSFSNFGLILTILICQFLLCSDQ